MSTTTEPTLLTAHARQLAQRAKDASLLLNTLSGAQRQAAILNIAKHLRQNTGPILHANKADLADAANLSKAMINRLTLDEKALHKMADAVEEIAKQVDPVGQVIEGRILPNGARLEKWRVPLGVVCIIFESRPNVLTDAAALCLKSGNACILRGGKECLHTNQALGECLAKALAEAGLPGNAVVVVDTPDRALVPALLQNSDLIDLVIPRGGENLIRAVVESSKVPVIKHYTGNCHIYVHAGAVQAGLEKMVLDVCVNAKCQRPGTCNAVETILFDEISAPALLAKVCKPLTEKGVEIRGCEQTCKLYPSAKPATPEDWHKEYLDLIVAVKVVPGLSEAIAHINQHSSKHTEAILTGDHAAAERFLREVDSAGVMVNASTRLADGGEYGLGAEIGISTDKLHARGPMGAGDLCTYKWVLIGHGQIRT